VYGAEAGIISEGVAQVVEDMGNPRSRRSDTPTSHYDLFASLRSSSAHLSAPINTYLTPVGCHQAGPRRVGLRWLCSTWAGACQQGQPHMLKWNFY
jgi:hypothetical protein